MANQNVKNEVKRLNQRLVQIGKDFGTNSQFYKDTIAPLMNTQFQNLLSYNKDGIPQLKRSNIAMKDDDYSHALNILRQKAKTITELAKEKTETKQEILERVERSHKRDFEMNSALEYLYNNYTQSEIESMHPELFNNERLSEEQFQSIIDEWKDATGYDDNETIPFD